MFAWADLGAVKKWVVSVAACMPQRFALALLMVATTLGARAQVWATVDLVTSRPAAMADVASASEPVARQHAFTQAERGRVAAANGSTNGSTDGRSLLDSYSQGEKDNCGSVALTKLVFALYGPAPASGPFSRVVQADGSFAVQLADGSSAAVTTQELRLAAGASGMEAGTGNTLDAANLLYAVMAVRLAHARDGHTLGRAAFERALTTLSKGGDEADEDKLAPLLGFAFDDRSADNSAKQVYLLSSPLHVAFAFEGNYDEHGAEGGESTRNFRREYRDAENDVMFRDFLETWHGPDGRPVLVRQCSEARPGWTPGTAKWIPRSACAM